MTPACTGLIRNHHVRFYHHPTVPGGMLWSVLEDVAGVVGYPPDMAVTVAATWRQHWPSLCKQTDDGHVAVPSSVIYAFMSWLDAIGLDKAATLSNEYEAEVGRAYLILTAHLPRDQWQEALTRSSLADMLPDPGARPN